MAHHQNHLVLGLLFLLSSLAISLTVYNFFHINTPTKHYSYIGQVDGGEARCFTDTIPNNATSTYIERHLGTYSMKYRAPARLIGETTGLIRNGIVDFTPVNHCKPTMRW